MKNASGRIAGAPEIAERSGRAMKRKAPWEILADLKRSPFDSSDLARLLRPFDPPAPPDLSVPSEFKVHYPPLPAGRPLAEQIADAIKAQGAPGHTVETRGRKPHKDWERAMLAVFGRSYRGEVPEPQTQAEVERLLADWFAEHHAGWTPGETAIREKARLIWREVGN
jgi:hypothetical protein